MLKNRIFTPVFIFMLALSLLIGQVLIVPNMSAHAQTATSIDFPNMTQLSPNGQKVVYVTAQNLNMLGSTIWVANADLSQPIPLVTGDSSGDTYWVTNPLWSPDGQQIAYMKVVKTGVTSFINYRYEIWAINSDRSNNRLLVDALFSPSTSYGGQTADFSWDSTASEVNFSNLVTFPVTKYIVNTTTLVISQVSNGDVLPDVPSSADIEDVTQYLQTTSPWAQDYINDDSANCATLYDKGSALTSSAMVLNYLFPAPADPINPGDVNRAMRNVPNGFQGFQDNCYIIWTSLSTPYSTATIDASSLSRPSTIGESSWKIQLLPKLQSRVSEGVPVILWYYLTSDQSYGAAKNFVTVIGYNGSDIYVYDPKVNDTTTLHFFDTGIQTIQGLLVVTGVSHFSKASPENGITDIAPENITLSWDALDPTPKSYRYCVNPASEMSCSDPNNHDWTNVGLNTQVTRTLDPHTTYTWQVQAITDDSTTPKITLNANFVKGWTFTTGASSLVKFSGNTGVGETTITYTNVASGGGIITTEPDDGNYWFNAPNNSFGTITPSKTCYSFTPPARNYDTNSIPPQTTGFDFTANLNKYSISGNVGVGSAALNYTIDGITQTSIIADTSGQYTIPNLPCGSTVIITPTLNAYRFSPVSTTHSMTANQTQNYTAIYIYITVSGNAGVSGTTIEIFCGINGTANGNCATKYVVTDPSGNYSVLAPKGSTFTITPTNPYYTFSPENFVYQPPQTNSNVIQNFTAIQKLIISGKVNLPVGVPNVMIDFVTCSNVSSSENCIINTKIPPITTNNNGNYIAYVARNWSGKLRPRKDGYWFSPNAIPYINIQTDMFNQDYDYGYKISGDAQLDGVTLSYSVNGQARTVTSTAGGAYEILVPRTWTGGTITPSKAGIAFAPASKTYTNLQTPLTAEDYSLRLTFTSIPGYDGFVLESSKNSGAGGPTVNSTGQVIRLGDNLDRQYRSILSFDTSILPDDAIIQWATLKIRRNGNIIGTDPFTAGFGVLKADICEGKFGSLPELETADFNAGTTPSIPCLINAMNSNGFNATPSNDWHSASLSSNGLGYIHLVPSITQLRLYFELPNNNNAQTDYIDFNSGEAAAGLKPEFVIAYRLP